MRATLKTSLHPNNQTIVLASNNAGKLAEFERLFAPLDVCIEPQKNFNVSPAQEPFKTFVENALAKARHASAQTGLPAIADDSGICADALSGAPGVLSARYAASQLANDTLDTAVQTLLLGLEPDAANNALLLHQMQGVNQRRACFVATLVHVRHPDDPLPLIAQGIWWGEVAHKPSGAHGFGYDPVFWLPDLHCSAAELDATHKNEISHRGQALRALLAELKAIY
ncbi:MAG TPA: RdgB/HAM1 family non-canonical purine NTP pyrophosphatase [Paenalcaligenes sp.]|nr:RdgB/HAM1 family non-canonical purine NTP pyrophosphatase [Paenalcaligenes sp.]